MLRRGADVADCCVSPENIDLGMHVRYDADVERRIQTPRPLVSGEDVSIRVAVCHFIWSPGSHH